MQLRILRADGSLTPVRTVTTVDFAISVIRLAVGDDGRGVVVWDEWQGLDDITISLYARRVTRDGRLGPVRRVVPRTHNVSTAQVAVGPDGRAIVTWSRLRIGQSSCTPWMRTFGSNSALGRVHELGRGPNADAPQIGIDRDGRALLAWSNGARILARRVSRSGSLGPTVRVHRGVAGDGLGPTTVSVDRDGYALLTWTRAHGYTPEDYVQQTWGQRLSPSTRPLGAARLISRRGQRAVSNDADMDLQGDAVVTWNVGYYDGIFARHVHRDGTMGPRVRLGTGGLGPVALDDDGDGAIAWAGLRDGVPKAIRVTRIRRDGGFGRTITVGLNGSDTYRVTVDAAPKGRITVAWPETPAADARIYVVRGR